MWKDFLRVDLLRSFYDLTSWASHVKLISGEWHRTPLILSQHQLFQIMAWCREATTHYLSQCWHRSMSPYGALGITELNQSHPRRSRSLFRVFPRWRNSVLLERYNRSGRPYDQMDEIFQRKHNVEFIAVLFLLCSAFYMQLTIFKIFIHIY